MPVHASHTNKDRYDRTKYYRVGEEAILLPSKMRRLETGGLPREDRTVVRPRFFR